MQGRRALSNSHIQCQLDQIFLDQNLKCSHPSVSSSSILILNTCPQCNQNSPFPCPIFAIPAKAVDKESNGKGSNHTTNGEDGHRQGPEGREKHCSGRVFELLFHSVIDKILYDLQIKMVGGRADCYSWMRKDNKYWGSSLPYITITTLQVEN